MKITPQEKERLSRRTTDYRLLNFIRRLDYLVRSYTYLGWNEKSPLFDSAQVRRALTMAIDRTRLIRQNLNGQAVEITGPFFYGSDANNPEIPPYPYDPDRAKLILAEEASRIPCGSGMRFPVDPADQLHNPCS